MEEKAIIALKIGVGLFFEEDGRWTWDKGSLTNEQWLKLGEHENRLDGRAGWIWFDTSIQALAKAAEILA